MYPVTAGGFQTNSGASSQLRQGNMVFGFFLDGQDQQVPVIMGVLGNNSQTELSQIIGDNSVTNAQAGSIAKSGYASGSKSKGNAKEITSTKTRLLNNLEDVGQQVSKQSIHRVVQILHPQVLIIQTQIIQMLLKKQDQVLHQRQVLPLRMKQFIRLLREM